MKFLSFILAVLPFFAFGQMNMEGSATGACDCYTLTDNTNQTAAIWSPNTIDLTNPFDFTFEVNLGCNDVWGADGMMFVLQQNGTGTGSIGNGIGYGDYPGNPNPISTNSIGIEIDTWDSNPAVPTDIASDHVAMSSAGGNDHDVVAPIAIPNIEDCAPHLFQITWDPIGQNLEVFIDGTSIFVYNGDLVTNFFGGNPNVYFGWTGGTGGIDNVQTVCMYRNAAFTPDQVNVCENQQVTFTDNSTSELNMITNWDWAFGDGGTSTAQNPTHTYTTAGNYVAQLTMTDISGCTDVATVNITVTPGLNLTMTATDVTCFGALDGTTTATPTNGTGPYNYTWDDPGTQGTQTATGLGPNNYNVSVTDANGCAGIGNVIVNEPTALVLDSAIAVDASCGVNNGTITFYPNGGTAPYSYSIDGGGTFQAGATFNGLAPNAYNLELQDANGCSVTAVLNLNSNSAMVLDSLVATDETCGQSDGTITAYVTAGLAPYQYSLDAGVTYQVPSVFTNLAANNYTVQILDANNCIVTGNVTVNAPTTLAITSVTPTDPSCNGSADGQIDIVGSGGTAPFMYSIDNGVTFQAGSNFTGLISGNYPVVLEDASGCQVTGNTVLTDPVAVVINNIATTAVSCNGSTDGQIDITAGGGVPGYTYSIDGGITFHAGNVFTNLAPNNYNIQVNDANNCTVTGNATVAEPLPLILDSIVVLDVTCNGLSDGGVTIYPNQGTPAFQYSIDGGVTFQGAQTFNGLGGGNVTVDVMDANGCTVSGNAFISESQPLVANVTADTTICIGGTADICPTLVGGTAPFTYTYNGIGGGACLATSVAGVYNIEITDANNCTSNIVSQEVFLNPAITMVVSPDVTICAGDAVTLTAEANGGDGGPYTYTWVNQNDLSVTNGAVQTFNLDQTTTFTVAAQDGCETPPGTGTVTVNTFPVPQIQISADNYSGCEPVDVVFTNNTDPSLLASASWTLGNGDSYTGTNNIVSTTYDTPGCYDVTVQITTVDGCVSDTTLTDFICVYEVPTADFGYLPNDPDILDPSVQFGNHSENGSLYQWNFGDGTTSVETHPLHDFPETGGATYQVQLITSTAFGCTDTTVQDVIVNEVVLFYAPNSVTPNGDNMNNSWLPVFIPGFDPLGYKLVIFNRWGEIMFESEDVNVGWDCSFGGNIVPDDAYVWQISFRENQTDKTHRYFGHITVLK